MSPRSMEIKVYPVVQLNSKLFSVLARQHQKLLDKQMLTEFPSFLINLLQ